MIYSSGFQVILSKVCFLVLFSHEGFCGSAPAAGRAVVSVSSVTPCLGKEFCPNSTGNKSEQRTADTKAQLK